MASQSNSNNDQQNLLQPLDAEELKRAEKEDVASAGIQFTLNVQETIKDMKAEQARKIMIAIDTSPFSQKAVNFVRDNLLRADDALLLISIWEEAMVNKLVSELDKNIIHPMAIVTPSSSGTRKFANTFDQAACFNDHKNLTALLVKATARISTKTIGEELSEFVDRMGVDILVCGTRGLGGIKKTFLGSVSTYVASNCKCNTIIVRK